MNNNNIPIIDEGKDGYWIIYTDEQNKITKKEWVNNPPYSIEEDIFNMIDYNQFDEIVKEKRKKSKFLYLDVNQTAIFTFLNMGIAKVQNPFNQEIEDAWIITLLNEEGVEKQWTVRSLSVYEQFKRQNIQEQDKIKITRVPAGRNSKYIVLKMDQLLEKEK